MIKIEKFKDLDTSGVATAGDLGQMPQLKIIYLPFNNIIFNKFCLKN
jgi:hypothetical protein